MGDPTTPAWLVTALTHLGVAGTVALVLGWLLVRSEKRVAELMDMLVEIARSSVKVHEQTVAAINANTAATKEQAVNSKEQAVETRALKGSIDMLLAERGRRGR